MAFMSGIPAILAALVAAGPVTACGYGRPSPVVRFFRADVIVVGKVVRTEAQPVNLSVVPDGKQQEMKVTVIEVLRDIKGAEGVTHLSLALHPELSLPVGQVSCFVLVEHFQEPVYLLDGRYEYPLPLTEEQTEVKQFARWAALLAEPQCGLTSRNPEDRYLTAALLLAKHRLDERRSKTPQPFDAKTNRLVLEGLALGDGDKDHGDRTLNFRMVFRSLGLTEKDDWVAAEFKTNEQYDDGARDWLRRHATKFVIR
jgi:hypothetical protein